MQVDSLLSDPPGNIQHEFTDFFLFLFFGGDSFVLLECIIPLELQGICGVILFLQDLHQLLHVKES